MTDLDVPLADPGSDLDPDYTGAGRLVLSATDITRDRDAWLAARRCDGEPGPGRWRVTASEMAAVLGLAPPEHGSAFSLYHAKMNGVSIFAGNDRTDIGLALEDLVGAKFGARYPDLEVGMGGFYVSRSHPWLGATPDKIAYARSWVGPQFTRPAATVQIKTWASAGMAEFGTDESDVMPVQLRVQNLVEMFVLGTDTAYEPVMPLPDGRMRVMKIVRDERAERDIAAILAAGEEFISWLDQELEPEVDWTPAAARTLWQLNTPLEDRDHKIDTILAAQIREARRAVKAAEEDLGLYLNTAMHEAGNARRVVADDPITGTERLVFSRSSGPRAGFTVQPKDRVDSHHWGSFGNE